MYPLSKQGRPSAPRLAPSLPCHLGRRPSSRRLAATSPLSLTDGGAGNPITISIDVGDPIVILATGQSNFVQRPSLAWSPSSNALAWNWNDVDGSVGTAFEAIPSTTINLPEKVASDIAATYPGRPVYIIGIAIGSQDISHWMAGATAPDMYANITANVVPALALIGVNHINFLLWWQGENQTAFPENYIDNFNTVMTRFQGESWFPRATPVVIYGLAPTTISGDIQTDTTNARLQAAARAETSTRRFIYTGDFNASYWADTLHPNAAGFFAMGEQASNAIIYGQPDNKPFDPVRLVNRNGVGFRQAFRSLIQGGDYTVNPWPFGTTFTSVATGTNIVNGVTWIQSGVGVVDILRTADAPTIAQAGTYTQHCLHVDVTTADASIGNPDYYGFEFDVDGLTSSFLGFGQTNSTPVIFTFWVKSTVIGNYFVSIGNSAQNRSFCAQYTISAPDTWEKQEIPIPGDVTGTWLYTSGVGLRCFFTLASSDTYLFTPNAWGVGDVRVGSATRANAMSSTSNNFKIALPELKPGVDASKFDGAGPSGSVTNSMLANMANFTIKGRHTVATGVPEDLTVAQVGAIVTSPVLFPTAAVNFNAANTDHPVAITLPTGYTKYRIGSITVVNTGATASLTTARAGVFTQANGTGTTLVTDVALSAITQNTQLTSSALLVHTIAIAGGLMWVSGTTVPTIYYRVSTAQGASASGTVIVQIIPF